MQIAIDTSPLFSGHSGRGIGSYTKNLVAALRCFGKDHTIVEFTKEKGIPKAADIVHYPYFDPFFLTLPLVKSKPTIVTVHDLIPLIFPDKFPVGIRGWVDWQIQKQSLRGAKRILADSNSSKNDIKKMIGINSDVIDTVYLAPDPAYHVGAKSAVMPEKYILYVGDVNWNKNVMGLLQAFSTLQEHKEFNNYYLVLVGKAFLDGKLAETQIINQYMREHALEKFIIRPGAVSIEELCSIYSGARVYVQPSHYEGFGLPVLEAFVCGCPVVCTNTSSLNEIAGPAVQVTPTVDDLASGIMQIIRSDRKQQINKQFAWVKQFTWEKVAKETIAAYERAME